MKILVTGGAGFIGSHLTNRLLSDNHQVIVIDNLSTGTLENTKAFSGNKNFKFFKSSIENINLLKQLVNKVDLVYHLAAVVGVSNVIENPVKGIHTNCLASLQLINLSFKLGKVFIFASSSESYGKNQKRGLSETDDSIFGSPYNTRWWYGVSKLLDEHLLLSYAKLGFKAVALRFFNIYGPKSKNPVYSNVVPKFIAQALKNKPITIYGDGAQIRSFTYIEDVIDALIVVANNKKCFGQVLNLARVEPITILELAQKIKRLTGSQSEIINTAQEKDFEESPVRVPDTSKLISLIGFKSKTNLEDGLKKTIQWYKYENK